MKPRVELWFVFFLLISIPAALSSQDSLESRTWFERSPGLFSGGWDSGARWTRAEGEVGLANLIAELRSEGVSSQQGEARFDARAEEYRRLAEELEQVLFRWRRASQPEATCDLEFMAQTGIDRTSCGGRLDVDVSIHGVGSDCRPCWVAVQTGWSAECGTQTQSFSRLCTTTGSLDFECHISDEAPREWDSLYMWVHTWIVCDGGTPSVHLIQEDYERSEGPSSCGSCS
ncbi:MAG: hypothetical protein AAF604_03625 [Acidobacteriota bacterium]